MGVPLLLILTTILLLSGLIIGKTIYYRNKVTVMTGMMISMSIGMSVGLTVGVIFGIMIPDNFFIATMLGIILGMSVGFLAGIPVSIMAVLEGLLSGVMGGMMGVMLGAMIVVEYHDAIVKIMFFIFIETLLILLYLIQKETNKNITPFYANPLFTIILFGLIFIIFNLLGPIFTNVHDSIPHNYIENHSEP